MNNRQFMKALNEIDDRYILEATDTEHIKELFKNFDEDGEQRNIKPENHNSGENISKRKRRNLHTLLIAAIIGAMILFAGTALASRFDSFEVLKDFGNKIVEMIVGEKKDYQGLTISKTEEAEMYGSVKEFFEATDFEILYPDKLPEGVELVSVNTTGSYDSQFNYIPEYRRIMYTTSQVLFYGVTVWTNPDFDRSFLTNPKSKIETINGYECYTVDITNNNTKLCNFVFENNTYTIIAPTYDEIVLIVSNMKKYGE